MAEEELLCTPIDERGLVSSTCKEGLCEIRCFDFTPAWIVLVLCMCAEDTANDQAMRIEARLHCDHLLEHTIHLAFINILDLLLLCGSQVHWYEARCIMICRHRTGAHEPLQRHAYQPHFCLSAQDLSRVNVGRPKLWSKITALC